MQIRTFRKLSRAKWFTDRLLALGVPFRCRLVTFPKRLGKPMVTEVIVFDAPN